jgi:hypothetical protein
MKKGNKNGGPGKGQKGKKEDSSSSNQGKDLSRIKCFKCQKFGHFASQCVMRRRGRASNSIRSSLQGVQKHHLEWMSFHPSLRHTSLWSHACHLTPCLVSENMWIVEPPNI